MTGRDYYNEERWTHHRKRLYELGMLHMRFVREYGREPSARELWEFEDWSGK